MIIKQAENYNGSTPAGGFTRNEETSGVNEKYSEPVSVVWKNLSVTADEKKSNIFTPSEHSYKKIIRDISGAIMPGTLVGILGASGSGKSTLMSVLANRNPSSLIVEGDIRVGGKPIGEFMRHVSGFVYQDDLFIPTLSVMEHLCFAARLRLDRRIRKEQRHELIMSVLTELGLLKCANNRIGSSKFGDEKVTLSGGERKRLSCATELLTDPLLLFCDEPTTGLDSFSALKLMSVMNSLAINKRKTIVCSIHQPNEQIFHLFHNIILLTSGKITFIGSTYDAITFFKSQGYAYDEDQNPADYLIKCVAEVPGNAEEHINRIKKISSSFEQSSYGKSVISHIEANITKHNRGISVLDFETDTRFHPSWSYKFCFITYRSWLAIIRDPSIQGVRVAQKMMLGLLIGLCMHGTVTKTQKGIQALQGVIFMIILQNFFTTIYTVVNYIPSQLPAFYREYDNGVNTPLIFFLSNHLPLLPGFIVEGCAFTLIIYFLAYLRQTVFAIFFTCLVTVLVIFTSAAFGTFMSTVCKNVQLALTISTPFDMCLVMLSGVYMKLSTVPWFLSWLKYVSWVTYACEALYIIQVYEVDDFECDPDPSLPCMKTGTDILHHYSYSEGFLWSDVMCIVVLYLTFNFLSYIFLSMRVRIRSI